MENHDIYVWWYNYNVDEKKSIGAYQYHHSFLHGITKAFNYTLLSSTNRQHKITLYRPS